MKRIFLILMLGVSLLSAASYTSMGQVKSIAGLDLRMTDYGSSVGGIWQLRLLNGFHAGLQTNWTFVSSGKEYTLTDPYTGYTNKLNTIHLDFIKAGVLLKKHFFTRQLDNTFAPFFSLQGGPVLAIDTDNDPWSNISRYQNAAFYLGFYTHLHFGIDFMMERRSSLTVALGYEINHFGQAVDEEFLKHSWNGAALILTYGRYF
ncbi:MAG: hypothetical protein WC372_12655 [Candidatus Neomarinimicrobiota bacterium]|jgi:hypothetical protein|nr:hypothetical protein [Candidatus Neomarinimicrobiota bacterium]MDD3965918.1 hypothetical protein [Candidatus Neomarinimicrobiota bacterium]MDX9780103.1 hypothetical protein [bacterium]